MSGLRIERCASAGAFVAATAAYRGADPLRCNVLGSVASSVAAGTAVYDAAYWWTILDGEGVVGAAMRTVPEALALGPMHPDAARCLADAVAVVDDALPAVTGVRPALEAFLTAYRATGSAGGARSVAREEVHVLYAIEEVAPIEVPGAPAVATVDDVDLAHDWFVAFDEEVSGHRHTPRARDRPGLVELVGAGRLRWWRHGGEVVSMAGHAVAVRDAARVVTRVGPVYTPPARRRRGYGGAVTAALATELLAGGSAVMLFADAANPTSNHVYQALGFERLDEVVRAVLEPSGA